MRQNGCYRNLKRTFKHMLPCYCDATKANSRTIRSRLLQPAFVTAKGADLRPKERIKWAAISWLHDYGTRTVNRLLCSFSVISANKLSFARICPTNRNWTADVTFSTNFCFLVPISIEGANACFSPPADAHGVHHFSRIPSDRLLFDETFTQPSIFSVLNCADVALTVFYSPVLTRCRIFLQLWTALSYRTADLCSLQWHIVAYNNE